MGNILSALLVICLIMFAVVYLIKELGANQSVKTVSLQNEESEKIEKTYAWHRTVRVRGTSFRNGALEALEAINKAQGNFPYLGITDKESIKEEVRELDKLESRFYEYPSVESTDIKLIPEPDNPADPNALMVEVSGHFVGYISQGYAKQLKKYVNNKDFIIGGEATLRGGRYKYWEDRRVKDGEIPVGCNIDLWVSRFEE